MKDKDFIRGKVPMTKEEVRAISISKLELNKNDICLDIGAGTGSVSIEMANLSKKVYSIEINEEAIFLIKENIKKFDIKNIELIQGKAPSDLDDIKFNKIFVGGSKGNLKEILEYSKIHLENNGKIVLNFIVLENLFIAIENLKKLNFENIEIINVSISRNKEINTLNMMIAENPVYIVSAEIPSS